MLPKTALGKTGLEVTKLGFGALELRDVQANGGRLPNEEHAGVVLNAVLEAGINFIDTSPAYGRSEEFIGRFIADRREEYYLATKCGRAQTGVPEGRHWSREAMLESIDNSLCRLGTDHVDLLQLHGPTAEHSPCITTPMGGSGFLAANTTTGGQAGKERGRLPKTVYAG